MLARWITTRITWPLMAAAVAVPLVLAGWQHLEARALKGQLTATQRELATTREAAATRLATIEQLRATLATERAEADAERARAAVAAREEAARQYRAGQAAAGLARHCVHDQGPAAVNRSLRDVLGETGK